jgi:hypothetical protein
LQHFTGKYELSTPPTEVSVELVAGKLKVIVPGQPILTLTPVQPTRFKAEGGPAAGFVAFQTEGDKVKGMQIELEDQQTLKMKLKN